MSSGRLLCWQAIRVLLFLEATTVGVEAVVRPEMEVRKYDVPLSEGERRDIRLIVSTLANSSLFRLWGQEKRLNDAGDRVNGVHPLKFLYCIFSDEELKNCVTVIKTRAIVGKRFEKGLFDSLDAETARQNMSEQIIQDFADSLGINAEDIRPAIKRERWDELVDLLIAKVPAKATTLSDAR